MRRLVRNLCQVGAAPRRTGTSIRSSHTVDIVTLHRAPSLAKAARGLILTPYDGHPLELTRALELTRDARFAHAISLKHQQ